jgi:GntR family transcriptional regulator / MocR family aminotransferase
MNGHSDEWHSGEWHWRERHCEDVQLAVQCGSRKVPIRRSLMEPFFDLRLQLPPRGSRTVLEAMHRQLRAAILDGRLQPGLRLPATRVLAHVAGVSRNTAMAAYELLLAEGYVESRQGAGTFVAASAMRPPRPAPAAPWARRSLVLKLQPPWRDAAAPALPNATPVRFDFRPGYPDPRDFPFDIWRRLTARALRRAGQTGAAFGDPQGDARLREGIAAHVSATRAVACTAGDVVVTAGAQQAFDLLARLLVAPGRTVVAFEDPGYLCLRSAFTSVGAVPCNVPVDAEGFMVEHCPRRVDVMAVAPSHQFPLGVTMSAARRAALLEHARRADAVIIEDDYDGEFRLAGRPLDALKTLDRDERVFYVGTFSKSLFPALRVGYVVAPPWARAALVAAKQASNWHVASTTQSIVADFIAEGHMARHVRRMRRLYAERQGRLLEAIDAHLGDSLQPLPSLAGLHLCAAVHPPRSAQRWAEAAAHKGVRVEPLSRHAFSAQAPNGLILGFGLIDARAIEPAVVALKRAAGQVLG